MDGIQFLVKKTFYFISVAPCPFTKGKGFRLGIVLVLICEFVEEVELYNLRNKICLSTFLRKSQEIMFFW